jgi:hypothetical protein
MRNGMMMMVVMMIRREKEGLLGLVWAPRDDAFLFLFLFSAVLFEAVLWADLEHLSHWAFDFLLKNATWALFLGFWELFLSPSNSSLLHLLHLPLHPFSLFSCVKAEEEEQDESGS